jgi:hypothetical protein
MSIDLEGELIEIKGEVKHCTRTEDGVYSVGVSFLSAGDTEREIIVKFIKAYHYGQKEEMIRVSGERESEP